MLVVSRYRSIAASVILPRVRFEAVLGVLPDGDGELVKTVAVVDGVEDAIGHQLVHVGAGVYPGSVRQRSLVHAEQDEVVEDVTTGDADVGVLQESDEVPGQGGLEVLELGRTQVEGNDDTVSVSGVREKNLFRYQMTLGVEAHGAKKVDALKKIVPDGLPLLDGVDLEETLVLESKSRVADRAKLLDLILQKIDEILVCGRHGELVDDPGELLDGLPRRIGWICCDLRSSKRRRNLNVQIR